MKVPIALLLLGPRARASAEDSADGSDVRRRRLEGRGNGKRDLADGKKLKSIA